MIECEIALKKFVPDAGERFNHFICTDYKKLLIELHKIIELIQYHAPKQLFSIPVKIKSPPNIIPHSLFDFLKSQEYVLFDITIENQPLLQERFIEIYQQSIKKWYIKQIQIQKPVFPLHEMVKFVRQPELLYLPDASPSELLQSTDIVRWQPQMQKVSLKENICPGQLNEQVATFIATFENVSNPDEHLKMVKDAFFPILNVLFLEIGPEGLLCLLQYLKVFDQEQLLHLSRAMFRVEQTQNIHQLAHPHSQYYIDIIAAWPKNLFHNWLNWYAFNSISISFVESIEALQKFWINCQDYQPHVPRLEINKPLHFKAMTEKMHQLMSCIDKKWKKIQLKFIFNLDWTQHHQIFQIINRKYQWVSPEMLNAEHSLHLGFNYLAQNLSDNSESSFERIKNHMLVHAPQAEFVAWLCCLKPLLMDEEITQIIFWFENRSYPQELLHQLKKIPLEQSFSSQIFSRMQKSAYFENQLALYHLWIGKNTQPSQLTWHSWITFYQKVKNPVEFNLEPFSTFAPIQIYFDCLLQSILKDSERTEILNSFSRLSEDLQKKIVLILLSYTHPEEALKNQRILNWISDPELSTQTEQCLNKHFPEPIFLYFQKATQWSLVMHSLKDMIHGLNNVLECFSNDSIKVFSYAFIEPSFKQCIQEKLVVELLKIKSCLLKINKLIQSLEEGHDTHHHFEELFQEFNELEIMIQAFMKKTLHDHLSAYIMGYNGLVISLFDSSLSSTTSNFRDLFCTMARRFEELRKIGIDKYFNHDVLQIMSKTAEGESILENIINKNIIQKISAQIPQKLEKTNHQELIKFLGKIHLESNSIEQFFQRIKVIEYVNVEWPKLSMALQRHHVSVEEIWQVCSKHQLANGEPVASTHWKICFELIENLIDTPNLINILEQFLKIKNKFPEKLNFNGEVDHPHWPFVISEVSKDFKSRANNPSFDILLEYAFEFYLKNGQPFNFEQFSHIFQKIQMDARHQLILLTEIRDANLTSIISEILARIQTILLQPESNSWIKLIEKILLATNLHIQLPEILNIFNSLKKESAFPWLEIIIEDEQSSLDDILRLISKIENLPAAWKNTYPNHSQPLKKIQPEKLLNPMPLSSIFQKAWENPRTMIDNLRTWIPQKNINIRTITEEQVPAYHPLAKKAWRMWQSPIRPPVAYINRWLSMSPDSTKLASELEKFDCWPHTQKQPEIVHFELERLHKFIKELEFHTDHLSWTKVKKEYLLQRLQTILNVLRMTSIQTLSQLLEEYHHLKNQLILGPSYSIELENHFIGIIISLYYKALKKQVYPTQILCLLLTLEYGNQNVIFEIDTGEGKSIINALLAILKYNRKQNNIVMVRTANDQLVFQDFFQKKHHAFFQLLGCPAKILKDFSDIENITHGGIFYISQLNLQIFNALNAQFKTLQFDMIADEVDEILDQTRPLSIVSPMYETLDIAWIYEEINHFVDLYHPKHLHLSEDAWLRRAQEHLLEKNQHQFEKIQQLRQIYSQRAIWKKLIQGSILSREYLKLENECYIIEKIPSADKVIYKITPYLDQKPFFGFHFGLDGLIQCLAKRLEPIKKIKFQIPPLSAISAFLNPFHYRNITHFTGLSGSNGKVIELNELTKIFEAQSVRIGRYKPKRLNFLPIILEAHPKEQLKSLIAFVLEKQQPILIFCENIQSAYFFYTQLSKLSCKKCFLITGQESQLERENWLYNKEATHHAGASGCITIGTSILGRGIDIIPIDTKGLIAIKTHLEENERIETQKNGRPARAGAKGDIVSILNIEEVLQKTRRFNLTNISIQTLTSYRAQVQKYKIKSLMSSRATQQLRLWCWTQLQELLHQSIEKVSYFYIYEYHLLKIFMSEWDSFSTEFDLKNEEHIDWMIRIWDKTKRILSNHGIPFKILTADDFKMQLQLSTHWKQVINPDLKNHTFFMNAPVTQKSTTFSPLSSQIFFEFDYRILIDLNPPSKTHWFMQWINPAAHAIGSYLLQDWEIFVKSPNSDNFQVFYETLLAAQKLYLMQKKQSFFRIDYWFSNLNSLKRWFDFEEKISNFIKLACAQEKVQYCSKHLQKTIFQKQPSHSESPFVQNFIKWIQIPIIWLISIFKKFMFRFYPDASKLYKEYLEHMKKFEAEKNLYNAQKFHQTLNQVLIFYDKMQSLPFWRIDKFYWLNYFYLLKNQIQGYSQALLADKEILNEFRLWFNDRKTHAYFRLQCLGHFLCQEHMISQKFNYTGFRNSPEAIYCILNQEYHEPNHDFTSQKIHEIGRYFKKELQLKYISSIQKKNERDQMKPHDLSQHSMYYELAKFVMIKHIKEGFDGSVDSSSIKMQVLEQELVNAESNREFLSLL